MHREAVIPLFGNHLNQGGLKLQRTIASISQFRSFVGLTLDLMEFLNQRVRDYCIGTISSRWRAKTHAIKLSKHWYGSDDRRRYFGRGIVFEPGEPPEIPNDMLNLWRGFGVESKKGDWSLMRTHIHDVICSGNEEHFQYLVRWMAYGVQHPDRPIGVAIALRGDEGAGNRWRRETARCQRHFWVKVRGVEGNVLDIAPALRSRRWKEEHLWNPSASVLKEIRADLDGSSRPPTSRSIRLLKAH